MKMITGLLAIVAGALVFDSAFAVPRYSASVPQVDSELNHMVQTKAALDHGVCFDKAAVAREDPTVRETIRGYLNGQGSPPESPNDALKDKTCGPLDYSKSYLHDFNDKVSQICNASPEARAICYLLAVSEFLGALPQGAVLNAEGEHNIKIVCTGGEEYVFDKDGRIVDRGINEGTFNLSPPEDWAGHALNDIIAAIQNLPEKSSLTRDEAIKALEECIRKRHAIIENSAAKTKKLFAGGNAPAIDTPKLDAKSPQTKSNEVRTSTFSNRETVNVDNSRPGVRGWCDCGDDRGKRYIVGDMFCMYEKLECDLAYTLCGRCGCVVRPKDCAGEGLQIVDVRLYRELKQEKGGKLEWLDAVKPLRARQSKIEAIPNGQIVVEGRCVCKVADPINVGFTYKITGEFYVCCTCGRVREPDENGGVPNGPTALSEMGLNEQAEKESERILNWLGEGKSLK